MRSFPFHFGSRTSSQSFGASSRVTASRVVRDHFGREIRAVPVIAVHHVLRRDRIRPRRDVRLEQILFRRAIECFRRRTEPDVGLRIRCLGANAVEYFLRPHVHPLHVDVGMRLLESLLEILEKLGSVRRINGENRSLVASSTRRASDAQMSRVRRRIIAAPGCRPLESPEFVIERRFTNSLAAPDTPAGSCRKNASVV